MRKQLIYFNGLPQLPTFRVGTEQKTRTVKIKTGCDSNPSFRGENKREMITKLPSKLQLQEAKLNETQVAWPLSIPVDQEIIFICM